jgi:hypothetical protein
VFLHPIANDNLADLGATVSPFTSLPKAPHIRTTQSKMTNDSAALALHGVPNADRMMNTTALKVWFGGPVRTLVKRGATDFRPAPK